MEISRLLGMRAWLVVASVGLLSGCGANDSGGRQAVSGKVTLKGAPLDQGTIQFMPSEGKGHNAVAGGATIVNGAYSIPREKGLPAGDYKVMIFSADAATATDALPGELSAPKEERIPPAFNVNSEITVTIVAGEAKPFDFEIP